MNFVSSEKETLETLLKEKIVYSLDYNLDTAGKPVKGVCGVTEQEIVCAHNGQIRFRCPLAEITEYQTAQLVGSGSFSIKRGEAPFEQMCIFTQDLLNAYAEMVKMLEYHGETGVFPEAEQELDDALRNCPKCGAVIPEGTDTCYHCAKKGKYLWKVFKLSLTYKWTLFGAVAATMGVQLLWILFPYIQGMIVDKYITPKSQDIRALMIIFALFALIPFLMMFLNMLNGRCAHFTALSVGRDLRKLLFDKIQAQSMKTANKRPTGEQIKRISNDTEKVQEFVAFHGREAFTRLLTMTVTIGVMVAINWRLTLWVLLPVPLTILTAQFLFKFIHQRYRMVWNNFGKSESTLHDILSGIMVVKVFGSEKREIEHYKGYSERFADSMYRADKFWYLAFPILGFIVTLGEYFYLYFGGQEVLQGALSLGELVQFASYVGMVYGPIRWIIQLPRIMAETAVSAGKIYEVIDEREDVIDLAQPKELDITGSVSFDHVNFGYKVYKPVLRDISFEVKPGEMIGIVGPSGVGKTTLINLIMRLYDVSGGSIKMDGMDLRDIAQQSLRGQIGVVLQETYLFDGSVLDNIIFAKPDASMVEVVEAAKVANAHEFICKMPDGYNEYIGNRGYKLSGGEKQRIAIARAVLRNPKILILDEATASLDTETEKLIQEALQKLMENRTTFAIAHRLSTLRNANRLIVLDKGKIAEMGTHDELLRNKSVYYNLVMAQRQTSKLNKDG